MLRPRRSRLLKQAPSTRVDRLALEARLEALGTDGPVAVALDRAADEQMRTLVSLSELTSTLALEYIERLRRPLPDLTPEAGALITTRAYCAHMAVETNPSAFGAAVVPVLGTLPLPRKDGTAPRDLANRVVRATRQNFSMIRALSDAVWSGFVACTMARVHEQAEPEGPFLSEVAVEGLARFGWVLRQVDLHYRQQPERRPLQQGRLARGR